jgi:anti-sigma factor RsiW
MLRMTQHGEQLDLEAQMVLYISGELTNGQKHAFEKRLAADAKLSAEVTKLRETQFFCADAFRSADEQRRLPVSEGVAVRRVGRAIAQWQIDRARRAVFTVGKTRRIPVWSYPAAAAAILIIGFLIWSSRQPIALPPAPDGIAVKNNAEDLQLDSSTDEQQPPQADSQNALADWIDNSFGNTQQASNVGNSEHALSDPTPSADSSDESVGPIFPVPEETIQ